MKAALAARLAECHLEMHPDKTKIVYCKDGRRKGEYPNTKFDFLGYCFRPKAAKNRKRNEVFTGFGPQVSAASLKAMRQKIRELNLRKRTHIRSGGYRPRDQPYPAGLAELLWTLHTDSNVSNMAVR